MQKSFLRASIRHLLGMYLLLNTCTLWAAVPQFGQAAAIGTNGASTFGVVFSEDSPRSAGISMWKNIGRGLSLVAIGGNGQSWGYLSSNNSLYFRAAGNETTSIPWQLVTQKPPSGSYAFNAGSQLVMSPVITSIAAGPDGNPWIVDNTNKTWYGTVTGVGTTAITVTWAQLPGTASPLRVISVAEDGQAWGITTANSIAYRSGIETNPMGTGWLAVPTPFTPGSTTPPTPSFSLGAGSGNTVWLLDNAAMVLWYGTMVPTTGQVTWQSVKSTFRANQLVVNKNGFMLIRNGADVPMYRGGISPSSPMGTSWQSLAGSLISIAIKSGVTEEQLRVQSDARAELERARAELEAKEAARLRELAKSGSITYGSIIKLSFPSVPGARLHSHDIKYWHKGSSLQQQVTGMAWGDIGDFWIVKGSLAQGDSYQLGQPVPNGATIRLALPRTNGMLHNHEEATIPSPQPGMLEVTGTKGDNAGDDWIVTTNDGGPWTVDSQITIRPATKLNSYYLATVPQTFSVRNNPGSGDEQRIVGLVTTPVFWQASLATDSEKTLVTQALDATAKAEAEKLAADEAARIAAAEAARIKAEAEAKALAEAEAARLAAEAAAAEAEKQEADAAAAKKAAEDALAAAKKAAAEKAAADKAAADAAAADKAAADKAAATKAAADKAAADKAAADKAAAIKAAADAAAAKVAADAASAKAAADAAAAKAAADAAAKAAVKADDQATVKEVKAAQAINAPVGFAQEDGATQNMAVGARNNALEIWCISLNGDSLERYDIDDTSNENPWADVPANDASGNALAQPLKMIALSLDGIMCLLDANGVAHQYDWDKKVFNKMLVGAANGLECIAAGNADNIWAADADTKQILRYDSVKGWQVVPGINGIYVAAGLDDTVMVIDDEGSVWNYDGVSGWVMMPGINLDRIAVGDSTNVWGINDGMVYQYINGGWVQFKGSNGAPATGFVEVFVDDSGVVWLIDNMNRVWENLAAVAAVTQAASIPVTLDVLPDVTLAPTVVAPSTAADVVAGTATAVGVPVVVAGVATTASSTVGTTAGKKKAKKKGAAKKAKRGSKSKRAKAKKDGTVDIKKSKKAKGKLDKKIKGKSAKRSKLNPKKKANARPSKKQKGGKMKKGLGSSVASSDKKAGKIRKDGTMQKDKEKKKTAGKKKHAKKKGLNPAIDDSVEDTAA